MSTSMVLLQWCEWGLIEGYGSAEIAKIRLRQIISTDRAAAKDGYWRKTGRRGPWLGDNPITPEVVYWSLFDWRPRYRWEVRR